MMRGAIMAAGLLGSLAVAAPGSAQTVVVPPGYAGPSGQCWWNEGPGPGRWVDCNSGKDNGDSGGAAGGTGAAGAGSAGGAGAAGGGGGAGGAGGR